MVGDAQPQALNLSLHPKPRSVRRLGEGNNWRHHRFAWKNVILTLVAGRDQLEPQAPSSAVPYAE